MRRALGVLAVVALLLAACGDDDDDPPSTPGAVLPAWLEALDPPDGLNRRPPYEGHDVWLDPLQQTIYVEDCAAARKATSEGEPYGPKPRRPDGSGGAAGWAYICNRQIS